MGGRKVLSCDQSPAGGFGEIDKKPGRDRDWPGAWGQVRFLLTERKASGASVLLKRREGSFRTFDTDIGGSRRKQKGGKADGRAFKGNGVYAGSHKALQQLRRRGIRNGKDNHWRHYKGVSPGYCLWRDCKAVPARV